MKNFTKTTNNLRILTVDFSLILLIAASYILTPVLCLGQAPGQTDFQLNCSPCHTIGQGDLVGPDLTNLMERREPDWALSFIRSPMALITDEDPVALELFDRYNQIPMPDQAHLGDEVINDIIEYIISQSEPSPNIQAQYLAADSEHAISLRERNSQTSVYVYAFAAVLLSILVIIITWSVRAAGDKSQLPD